MTTPPPRLRTPGSNRTLFFVIVGLAALLILCAVATQTLGWTRLCGGGLFLVGALFALLAEDKRWPLLILALGLALFFADSLLAFLSSGG